MAVTATEVAEIVEEITETEEIETGENEADIRETGIIETAGIRTGTTTETGLGHRDQLSWLNRRERRRERRLNNRNNWTKSFPHW